MLVLGEFQDWKSGTAGGVMIRAAHLRRETTEEFIQHIRFVFREFT